MQWDDTTNAGFSKHDPWLTVNSDYLEFNALAQRGDSDSVFNFYRRLITLKQTDECLVNGQFVPLSTFDSAVYCFAREAELQTELVIGLFSSHAVRFALLEGSHTKVRVLIHNYPNLQWLNKDTLKLAPYEAIILKLQ